MTQRTTELTLSERARAALWRWSPERTERLATAAVLAGVAIAGVANWIRKGQHQ